MKWIYFGVFINEWSKLRNLKALQDNGIKIPDDWKYFNHHMTIAFNDKSEKSEKLYNLYNPLFSASKKLIIDGIGISDDAIAVRVSFSKFPIANKVPHITIATPPNGKPVNSNKITNWFDIEPYVIHGIIEQFTK